MFGEKEIKAVVLDHLLKSGRIGPSSLVMSEMNLAGKVRRVDLGFVQGSELVAIEIKSEKDTLSRLAGQLAEYRKYFDRVVVVVAPKFLEAVTSLSNDDVEIWEASAGCVVPVRRGKLIKGINKSNYLELMTRREITFVARKVAVKSDGLAMYDLKRKVSGRLHRISKVNLKSVLIEGLVKRFGLTSQRFLVTACSVGTVDEDVVSLLSPYYRTQTGDFLVAS